MVKFVKDTFGKDVTEATVGRAIKRLGFTQIIIQRGERATRHDLPPEAEQVRQIAAQAIDEQMKINAQIKAQHAREAKVYSGGPRKGTCAWVRLPPGADTGFEPRKPRGRRNHPQQQALEGQQVLEGILESSTGVTDVQSLPVFLNLPNLPEEDYISPYT